MDFGSLEVPFTNEEMDNIVKEMPPDKSPVLMDLMALSLRNVGELLRSYFINYVLASMKET